MPISLIQRNDRSEPTELPLNSSVIRCTKNQSDRNYIATIIVLLKSDFPWMPPCASVGKASFESDSIWIHNRKNK